MNIQISDELRAYIDPLTINEYHALERSLLAEGCRDALVLWGDILIDGHNRYAICKKHQIEFKTIQNSRFASMEEVILWVIDNQLARRSVSDFQRGMLALRKKELIAQRPPLEVAAPAGTPVDSAEFAPAPVPKQSREEVAKSAGISSNTVTQIEKIRRAATPELVEAVRAGTISINAAATIAALPSDQQVAAVAGGRKELQQAAKQVREQRSANRPAPIKTAGIEESSNPLQQKIDALTAENLALKKQVEELQLALQAAQSA